MFLISVLAFLFPMENTTGGGVEGSSSSPDRNDPGHAENTNGGGGEGSSSTPNPNEPGQAENIPESRGGDSTPHDGGESPGSSSRQFVVRYWPVMGIEDPRSPLSTLPRAFHQESSSSSGGVGSSSGAATGASVAGGPPLSEGMQNIAVAAGEEVGGAGAVEAVGEPQEPDPAERNLPDLNEGQEEPQQEEKYLLPDLNVPPNPDENQG